MDTYFCGFLPRGEWQSSRKAGQQDARGWGFPFGHLQSAFWVPTAALAAGTRRGHHTQAPSSWSSRARTGEQGRDREGTLRDVNEPCVWRLNQGRAAGMEPKDGITTSYLVATEGHSEEVAAGAT